MRDKLLGSFAHVKSFAGKALSFSLAIPTCKLHVREVLKVQFRDICNRNFRNGLSLTNGEVTYLGDRNIISVTMFSDASERACGAVLIGVYC